MSAAEYADYRPGNKVQALCADGRKRSALILRDADTFYTIPARVSVKGRTVTGFVWLSDGILTFTADSWRANGALLVWQS